MTEFLRKRIPYEEFDYQTIMDILEGYARPRDKITDLLRKGVIIRVKKGLYIFGDDYRRAPYSREILANIIYGPSYISLEYALQYYGMIPERVESVTSVTSGRSRKFYTPVGLFTYRMVPLAAFRTGMDSVEIGGGRSFLIAVPEKALADKVREDRGTAIRTQKELEHYLLKDLRIDPSSLRGLDHGRLEDIAERYGSRKVRLLSAFVHRFRRQGREGAYA